MSTEYKQVIVIRHDLKMRLGKAIAQGSHASLAAAVAIMRGNDKADKEALQAWLNAGMTKICVRVNSAEELIELYRKALSERLPAVKITDSGRTEFHGVPTDTCIAIGPALVSRVDKITKDLKLL